ncbi:MAG: YdcF family protein, partial [Synergistaceae bacterium]|nr:YdcF family protein [Synergistaceae bacterium]
MTLSYFLYKTIGAFVTLPGSMILLCLVASLYFYLSRQNPRGPRLSPAAFTLFFALTFSLLSLPVFARLILSPLEKGFPLDLPESEKRTAVLVLAGGIVSKQTDEANLVFSMGAETLQRFVVGCTAAVGLKCPLVYSGGYPEKASSEEIEEMVRRTAGDISFRGTLIVEGNSRTTGENFELSAPLLREIGAERVVVVTTAYHLKRSLREANRFLSNLEVVPLPSGLLEDDGKTTPMDFIPSASAFLHTAAAVKEYIGSAASAIFSRPALP